MAVLIAGIVLIGSFGWWSISIAPKNPSPTVAAYPASVVPASPVACKVAGCGGEQCVDANSEDALYTCVARPEHQCYSSAVCELQPEGVCGWTFTPEAITCLDRVSENTKKGIVD